MCEITVRWPLRIDSAPLMDTFKVRIIPCPTGVKAVTGTADDVCPAWLATAVKEAAFVAES